MREDEIRRANVICVVYEMGNINSFNNAIDYWIPYIQKIQSKPIPIILVGNKLDAGELPTESEAIIEKTISEVKKKNFLST